MFLPTHFLYTHNRGRKRRRVIVGSIVGRLPLCTGVGDREGQSAGANEVIYMTIAAYDETDITPYVLLHGIYFI